tara:strand:- start:132 stop:818 length:687 start_codon:yes stop_codon:yes gene_type:complete
MIPKIIHQSWKSTDLSSYGNIATKSQESWLFFHGDFEYKFWTDNDIEKYISQQPEDIISIFESLDKNIKKMDFFRYLILYEFGGIYSDLDFVLYNPLPLNVLSKDFIGYRACRNHSDHYLLAGLDSFTRDDSDGEGKWVLGQAFFGCTPRHPGLLSLIKNIGEMLPFPPSKTNGDHQSNVLIHTGPEAMHKIFEIEGYIDNPSTHLFPKKQMNNNQGEIGRHYRKHNW